MCLHFVPIHCCIHTSHLGAFLYDKLTRRPSHCHLAVSLAVDVNEQTNDIFPALLILRPLLRRNYSCHILYSICIQMNVLTGMLLLLNSECRTFFLCRNYSEVVACNIVLSLSIQSFQAKVNKSHFSEWYAYLY